ncbi:DUF2911 domain-containing protein [Adhaeribacter rhizoryzae]|uniref:DUF2911 domain-containing protein n=1 Tax=Adhaeribacter rhizoryzae TaxID=2607907 RepID=A0A5M6DL45_9BACT|nr:DUF2911 domain-containing protein [Adhaeribacter rhizoryzae]KAA5548264.1 DUF2911 domain-containing protein [Adhaeribacter rhizoryzae]
MRRRGTIFTFVIALAIFCSQQVMAQLTIPAASSPATVTQRVGLTDITVKYSRPSLKGRKMFGETLPYGQPWRAGANNSTVIEFKDPVTLQGTPVPAGEYAIYTIPGETEWTVIFNKNTKLGGNTKDYKKEEDVARFKVKPLKTPTKTETLTINFADVTPSTANLEILWENTSVKVKIIAEVESKVMAQIQEQVINGKDVKPDLYAAAAVYYLDTNKDPKLALEWIKKANEKDPKFWNMHTQAKLHAKNKDYKGAIASAEKSIALAKEAKNDDYVRMNEKAIAEWKKM